MGLGPDHRPKPLPGANGAGWTAKAKRGEMRATYRLAASLPGDLDRFRTEVDRFKQGLSSATEFRSFRVPQGVYEQREDGTFMLRVRLPAGGVLPHQLHKLAQVARKYGNGVLHVTTRQDIQIHRVPLEQIHPALVELYGAGLSTKGGGGNTVRNVTACYDAGVCADEVFDVAPYAVAVTELLVDDPLSYRLPRKYKLGFSGCGRDCAGATVNDLGFIAKRRGEAPGFAVYVGGGMGAKSRVADLLEPFIPASEVHLAAEAVKRVFDRQGNRKNKHQARLRFVLEKYGLEQFRDWYQAEMQELRKAGLPAPELRDVGQPPASVPSPSAAAPAGFEEWRRASAEPQKQEGFCLVHIPLFLGDLDSERMEKLADVVAVHGEGMLRTTQWQNLVLRWVHEHELVEVYRKLKGLDLAAGIPPVVRNVIACAGAATCRLGICRSRALARSIVETITSDGLDLGRMGKLNLFVSGCPNACGRHPVGDVGLSGAARRVDGKLVPYYVVQLGGKVEEGRTRLAEGHQALPARNVPAFVRDFLRAFQDSRQFPDFEAFLAAGGKRAAERIGEQHREVPPFDEDKDYYFDLGAEELFSLSGRGPGECGAGVFDLIETDLASARDGVAAGRWYAATVHAARALLVTRGFEARRDREALALFAEHFVATGLVDGAFGRLVEKAKQYAESADREEALHADSDEVVQLVDAVHRLYESMDDSLRIPGPELPGAAEPRADAPPSEGVDREADFRGVVCPLNYVKVKLALAEMMEGQVLAVLLDAQGARNVPESAGRDGHTIVATQPEGDAWRILIRKAQGRK